MLTSAPRPLFFFLAPLWLTMACESNRCEVICDKVRSCSLPATSEARALADATCNADRDSALCQYEEGHTDMDPATQGGKASCVADKILRLAGLHSVEDAPFPEDVGLSDLLGHSSDSVNEQRVKEFADHGTADLSARLEYVI